MMDSSSNAEQHLALACKAGVDSPERDSISIICNAYYALIGQLFRVDAKLPGRHLDVLPIHSKALHQNWLIPHLMAALH